MRFILKPAAFSNDCIYADPWLDTDEGSTLFGRRPKPNHREFRKINGDAVHIIFVLQCDRPGAQFVKNQCAVVKKRLIQRDTVAVFQHRALC